MRTLNLDFLKNAGAAGYGPVFRNDKYSLAIAQVEGHFASVSLTLEGRVNLSGPWVAISGWKVSAPDAKASEVTAVGIYEYPIEGIVEFRFRVVSVAGGTVSVSGVLYDAADGSMYPQGAGAGSITFGDPALFVKGVAEQIFYDPSTGNIVGYDKTATEGSVSISVNLSEITGGMGNQLIGVLPDTARVSGTYTSAAFSLETREKIMGGEIAYNAVSQVCETVTAQSAVLTVTGSPAPSIGESKDDGYYWCYVRHVGDADNKGTNVSVDPVTGNVRDYAATTGEKYEVTYFSHVVSASMLPVPSVWNPVMMTVQTKYGVYSKQNGSAERGILKGWLYFIAPRCVLNADAGVNASQTANADTAGSWIALPEKPENMPVCDCSDAAHPMAYYVYVPCSDENDAVAGIVSVGRGLTLKHGKSAQLPIKLVMPDDSLIQPDFSTLGYMSENELVATVNNSGVVTGISEGNTVVWAYVNKSDGSSLSCSTIVVVEGNPVMLISQLGNIFVD